MNQNSCTIDEILENFEAHDDEIPKAGSLPMTFWLPAEYKEKYETLQRSSRQKFGKVLKEVLMKSIDRVKSDV